MSLNDWVKASRWTPPAWTARALSNMSWSRRSGVRRRTAPRRAAWRLGGGDGEDGFGLGVEEALFERVGRDQLRLGGLAAAGGAQQDLHLEVAGGERLAARDAGSQRAPPGCAGPAAAVAS